MNSGSAPFCLSCITGIPRKITVRKILAGVGLTARAAFGKPEGDPQGRQTPGIIHSMPTRPAFAKGLLKRSAKQLSAPFRYNLFEPCLSAPLKLPETNSNIFIKQL
jgi:hypothetical protein